MKALFEKVKGIFKRKAPPPWVFAQIHPEHPHGGLDHFSTDAQCPYKHAIKVTGISQSDARLHLTGKVLDWTRLTDRHWKDIENGKPAEIPYDTLKGMFR